MFNSGYQIGTYTLVSLLGRGGFGEVWLAEKHSQVFTKKVAVKLPHPDQVDFEAIRREAILWEEASGHPNVLPIIDADILDGQIIIVSEYASGGSLADKLKDKGKLSTKDAIETTIGILSGLEFLHDKKIIHRDIKPANILLQGNTPRLADFGISRAMNTSNISSMIIGTDAYMSPEAFDGKRNTPTDIWSVGVLFYQLLKGSLPFPQAHPSERMYAVLTKEFAQLPQEIPISLRNITQKALEKTPARRYQSASKMREDLEHALLRILHPSIQQKFDINHSVEANENTIQTALRKSEIKPLTHSQSDFQTERPTFYRKDDTLKTPPPIVRSPPKTIFSYQPENIKDAKSALGFSANVGAGICYLGNLICALGLIYSIIVIATDKNNKITRFHAFQSILLLCAYIVVNLIGGVFNSSQPNNPTTISTLLLIIIMLSLFVSMIYAAVKAFQGKVAKIPLIGNIAEKLSK